MVSSETMKKKRLFDQFFKDATVLFIGKMSQANLNFRQNCCCCFSFDAPTNFNFDEVEFVPCLYDYLILFSYNFFCSVKQNLSNAK